MKINWNEKKIHQRYSIILSRRCILIRVLVNLHLEFFINNHFRLWSLPHCSHSCSCCRCCWIFIVGFRMVDAKIGTMVQPNAWWNHIVHERNQMYMSKNRQNSVYCYFECMSVLQCIFIICCINFFRSLVSGALC